MNIFQRFFAWLAYIAPKANAVQPMAKITVVDNILLRGKFVRAWQARLNERETNGKNRSPYIDTVCKFFGLPPGQPYCIGGLLYEVDKALEGTNFHNPLPHTMSTQDFYNRTPNRYRKPKGMYPNRGDICIQVSRNDPYRGHAYGLIEDQIGAGQKTIEFNTDGSGGRDGDGVYVRSRTQDGDNAKEYRGAVDIVQWIIDYNKGK